MTSQASPASAQGPMQAVPPAPPVTPRRRWWRTEANPVTRLLYFAFLAFCTVLFVYPFLWAVSASLKPREEVFDNKLIPQHFHPSNYLDVFRGVSDIVYKAQFGTWLWNSLWIGILYLLIFNGSYGILNRGLALIGITGPFWTTSPHWVKPGLVLMISVWAVGGSVVIFLAALMGVPRHLYEAAEMDGAGKWRRFRDVTLPMISPAIFFVVIINTIAGLQTFDQVYTAFFNASTPNGTDSSLMYAIYIFQQAFRFFKLGYAAALSWVLFAIIAVITAIQIVVSRRYVYYEGQSK